MIPRYCREEMRSIWTEQQKVELWLDVEIAAMAGWAELGVVPAEAVARVRERASINLERIAEIEAVTRHDVAAFVQSLEEQVGEEDGRFIHLGLTSSDVLDTALSLQLVQAIDLIDHGLVTLGEAVRSQAMTHRTTPMIGRSHAIHAEPITFGLTLAIWFDEIARHRDRLAEARGRIAVGKISGSVGTFANVDPRVEQHACDLLGLTPAPASSQILQRDRHAELFCVLALIASSLEKFATEIRHLHRTEVLEVEEAFRKGQKGSSSMPHKKNPVLSENVTGLARLVRSYCLPAMENVALWHQRDISHSSVERIIAPDAFVTLDFALHRFARVIDNLVVRPENMARNLEITRGLVYSQRLLTQLILRAGLSREAAYAATQAVALKAIEANAPLLEVALDDVTMMEKLGEDTVRKCFDIEASLQHVDHIFGRVFGDPTEVVAPIPRN